MPVPKRKTSKARRDKRAAGKHIDRNLPGARCQTCQMSVEPHSVCKSCGYYKGVKILRTKLERSADRQMVRQEKKKAILKSRGAAPEQQNTDLQ